MSDFPSEEIKSRLDIVDVLSEYIRLQKQGANYRALCPFHNEKTPSFFVTPARQIWHCFGCGEGGDIFSFVMKMEGVEFVDALRILAKKAGVQLKQADPKITSERSLLQEICSETARFFQNNLAGKKGAEALAYIQKRGLNENTIGEFKIGYALDEWTALYDFLSLKGYKPDVMEKAGLVSVSEKSGWKKYFDRFHDRLMFPLEDQNGAVIGFTGRYLKEKENEGKYVNSPQTPIFNKSAYLYGLGKSKVEIRKNDLAVVVEGQMDYLMAWQDGVKNIVAVSGTAFTPQQLDLLGRYTHNLCLIFDADSAGDSATQKSIALAHNSGFSVKITRIPNGKDPADFVATHSGQFAQEIKKAVSAMDYYFQFAFEKYGPKNIDGKKKIGEILLPQIKKIKNKIEAHYWLEELATKLGTKIEYLEEEMKQTFLEPETGGYPKDHRPEGESPPQKTHQDALLEHLMSLMYSLKNSAAVKKSFETLKQFQFPGIIAQGKNTPAALIFDIFYKYGKIDRLSEDFSADLDEAGRSVLRKIMLDAELTSYDDTEREILFCASRIEKEMINDQLKELEAELKQAEAAKDAKRAGDLLKKVSALSARKTALKNLTYNSFSYEEKSKKN